METTMNEVTPEEIETLAKEASVADVKLGMVIYTDGGARPNPGYAGWGMHGYYFKCEKPKKGSGCPDHLLTDKGYIPTEKLSLEIGGDANQKRREEITNEVTPISYVDAYGSFTGDVSNNVAELFALENAFMYALEYKIDFLQIHADSEYVRKCYKHALDHWATNGWMLRDKETPVANVSYWQRVKALRDRLRQRGVEITIDHIEAHSDHFGNELADKYATTGRTASEHHTLINSIKTSPAEGYWKSTVERHPMLNLPKMIFNSNQKYVEKGVYYLSNHNRPIDLIGKRISDGAFAVVRLKEPSVAIETVREHQFKLSGTLDTLVSAKLDQLFSYSTYRHITMHGEHALQRFKNTRHLCDLSSQPVTEELTEPKIAIRAAEELSYLCEKLDKFLAGNSSLTVTDLTPILYETTESTSKKGVVTKEIKLKPQFGVGYAALQIDANYAFDGVAKSAPLTLTLGLDLPDRNALKRLENSQPKISLITWSDVVDAFRYATVVQADGDVGIWAGVYSNLRFIT